MIQSPYSPSHISFNNKSVQVTNQTALRNKETEKKKNRRRPRNKKSVSIVKCTYGQENSAINCASVIHSTSSSPSTSRSNHVEKNKNVKNNVRRKKEENFNVVFKTLTNQQVGTPYRTRNSNYKYINLKSFCPSKFVKTSVFETNVDFIKLIGHFNKLSISENTSKIEKRKYPNKQLGNKEKSSESFLNYFTIDNVTAGLANGSLFKGFLRINPKNSRDAYVSNEDTSLADYYLTSVVDRNRALEGDEVILQVKNEGEWINGQKTARIVFIKQQVHSRIVVGTIKQQKKRTIKDYAILYSRDKRCPNLRIPQNNWPKGFKENPTQFENILFVAKLLEWTVPDYAIGVITEQLGPAGDLKVETLSILREFCLDITPFGDNIKDFLPTSKTLTENDTINRLDLRKECIFSIDPETARDLDDAVSAKQLPNGNYEIGVHISDASYYLDEGTELDQIVSRKATTIYMVDNVYHMLPTELCLFCSLLPGEDKLAFSVIWEITPEMEIVSTKFHRTIINSCAQLAYEHAQMIIENSVKYEKLPAIYNGFTTENIIETIHILQKIAIHLRQKRVEHGSLKIDQIKLNFNLDRQTGEPVEFWKYENKDSHRLIEEFMLLANISVAKKIETIFPNIAFLRSHERPKQTMLIDLKNTLASYGIHVDISSAGNISSSLKKYITDDYAGECRSIVLNHLTAKTMTRAKYFCASTVESEEDYTHYALSIPIYTHFTSPIRRYADIMVHRLLAACLKYRDPPEWDVDYVSAIAANCNKQKYNAKRAGEASMELYLGHYIAKHAPYEQDCVVVDVKERSFDAIVLKTGSLVRINKKNCEDGIVWKTEVIAVAKVVNNGNNKALESERKQLRLTITFPKTEELAETSLNIEIFSIVKINLEKRSSSYKLDGELVKPLRSRVFVNKQEPVVNNTYLTATL